MLKVVNLEGIRGERKVFEGVSFELKAGQCLLVEGSNGSGKTTLLRTLVGLIPASTKTILWNGYPIRQLGDEYRRELLYSGHLVALKEELSATENLVAAIALANQSVDPSIVRDALCGSGLKGREDLPVRNLSQGQKRRVNLARLLLERRTLWVLDEPLTALDAAACQWLEGLIGKHLGDGGMAIVVSHQELALTKTRVMRLSM